MSACVVIGSTSINMTLMDSNILVIITGTWGWDQVWDFLGGMVIRFGCILCYKVEMNLSLNNWVLQDTILPHYL